MDWIIQTVPVQSCDITLNIPYVRHTQFWPTQINRSKTSIITWPEWKLLARDTSVTERKLRFVKSTWAERVSHSVPGGQIIRSPAWKPLIEPPYTNNGHVTGHFFSSSSQLEDVMSAFVSMETLYALLWKVRSNGWLSGFLWAGKRKNFASMT